MSTPLQQHLESLQACAEAIAWAGDRTARQAWDECPRADWLLWWAAKTPANTRSEIVLTVWVCVRRALRFVAAGEDRSRLAIEAVERWARDPSEVNRLAAAQAAAAAAWAAGAAWAAAAVAAVWAAGATWAAWATLAAGAALAAEHRELCRIVRQRLRLPWTELEAAA